MKSQFCKQNKMNSDGELISNGDDDDDWNMKGWANGNDDDNDDNDDGDDDD